VPSAVFLCCNRALTNTFHGAVLEAAVTRLNDLGWQTVLLRWDTPPDPPFPPKILSRVGTDVLIFAGITSAGILDCCRAFGHPMIVSQLGFEPPDQMKGCDKVAVDELEAFKMAVLHLVELGHRRIGIVTDPAFPWSARELAWWETECKRRGLPFVQPPPIHAKTPGEYPRLGYLSAEQYLSGSEPPTALVAADDMMLFGISRVYTSRKIRVPADLSLVGKGGHPSLEFVGDPWSTVSMSPDLIGSALAELAERRREHPQDPPRTITVRPVFIDNGSTAPLKTRA
jgi:DNA-binding LacI/PurR family transcriptional regulator